jgi:alpha-beta hydrolase superfamily lysophospholipase
VEIRETTITTSFGKINLMHFPSKYSYNNNNCTILCIHGSYSDARIFKYIATRLSENGFSVYSMDLPGHGKSDGERGDLNFDACLRSINEIIRKIRGNSNVFILAHSIGCTFALWYAHIFEECVNGLILMAPYIRVKSVKKRSAAEPNLLYFLYLIFRRLLTPKTRVNITKVLPQLINIGGEELSQMLQDKELNFHYSYRYIVDIIALRNSKVKELADINDDISILILHGKNDLIFFSAVSEAFFRLLKSRNKTIKLFDCNHWFYNALSYNHTDYLLSKYSEDSRKEMIKTIKEWIIENKSR